jgi:hypothetical protein
VIGAGELQNRIAAPTVEVRVRHPFRYGGFMRLPGERLTMTEAQAVALGTLVRPVLTLRERSIS